jgi:hypothetical protein
MMADRGLKYVVAAFGLSVLAGGALAEQSWQGYTPRCQPPELAAPSDDPCAAQVAVFGLSGPTVLSHNQPLDVETTGSITTDRKPAETESSRSPM